MFAKVYKPEITACPFCGSKLKYRYTVSDKVIQFSHGENLRIKNLGYSCKNSACKHADYIYVSQTARKLCVKGYTYSTKVLAQIILYKRIMHLSRDEIADKLAENGIEISDRNVDIINDKLGGLLNMDYKSNIEYHYSNMERECEGIYLSIDTVGLDYGYRFIAVRNPFTSQIIGCQLVSDTDYSILDEYLSPDKNIKLIITVRPIFQTFEEIKRRCPETTKFLSYDKY